MVRLTLLLALFASIPHCDAAAAEPESTINFQRLNRIDRIVSEGLKRNQFPGCVVLIQYKGAPVFEKAYGNLQTVPEVIPMQVDTVFDLASLTKPIATASSIHLLAERGEIDLQETAHHYLPDFRGDGKEAITIEQLLTHTSGLIPDNALSDYQSGREEAYENINKLSLSAQPGEKFMYSDVGFIVLGRIAETVTGQRLDKFCDAELFTPLQMSETGYLPDASLRERAATTQKRNEKWMRGEVHDPRAFEMDGVAGHAGLFSTAQDLSRFAEMILNDGELDGVRLFTPASIQRMTESVDVPRGIRSLGWDKQSPYSSNKGDLLTDSGIGHGGFTGTGIWIDPELDLAVIFLSNRVHPDGSGSVNSLIGRISTVATAALPDESD
ncbi:Penicillin-binding protein 4* [Thalassoglobus neptunius]|uniref:Penicillin-binding protein 4 n=1 Tax=Thalassoglobus neptunius TaxID=1938619 RepID=A0A5C5X5G6_9PLAN|nr:serine hydrolase domain-containing protein [Thalassoglobus neptunius]TWT57493.1 Penicillin-binding protein 4* [Thalassoglobus neptunius]